MAPAFQYYEIVRVIAQSPRIKMNLIHKVGFVVGWSDNKRDYAVHINEFGETFAGFSAGDLESTGRIGTDQDIVSRGSQIGHRRSVWPPPENPK
jgi:hypothetical protein